MVDKRIKSAGKGSITGKPKLRKFGKDAETPGSSKPREKVDDHKDNFREIIETVVFVVVLVLLLKMFIAEAFVIPTGSMATTLLGYNKSETCPQCGYYFNVNGGQESPENGNPHAVKLSGCICPNCRYKFNPQTN